MKVLVIVSTFAVLSLAEPPPSNSYLPPSSNHGGYPQGPQGFGPQVVAARSLDQSHGGPSARAGASAHGGPGGFGRNSAPNHGPQARFAGNGDQGYDHNAAAFGRNALDEASTVSYEADERGFKPHISYEDSEGDALSRSGGYDSNANNVRSGDHGNHGNDFANGRSSHGNGYQNGANARSNNGY